MTVVADKVADGLHGGSSKWRISIRSDPENKISDFYCLQASSRPPRSSTSVQLATVREHQSSQGFRRTRMCARDIVSSRSSNCLPSFVSRTRRPTSTPLVRNAAKVRYIHRFPRALRVLQATPPGRPSLLLCSPVLHLLEEIHNPSANAQHRPIQSVTPEIRVPSS